MARSNMQAARVKPETAELVTMKVLRSEQISPNFRRVTFGGGDLGRFRPMGFDQWFRLFIPVAEDSLGRLPDRLTTLSYAKYMLIPKAQRPVLRNYSVRAFRAAGADGADGPELDVDFVVHGTDGVAASWARRCSPGDEVAILDEGIAFSPPPSVQRVVIVADETGLPATAGILASLPSDTEGHALVEIPSAEDEQDLVKPEGVTLTWVERGSAADRPGRAVLAAAEALPVPTEPFYGWTVGESTLPVTLRRHWVKAGVPKDHIMFCGYWKAGDH